MTRITIDIAKEELDFIREALAQKYRNLISYLDECEIASQPDTFGASTLGEAHKQLNIEINEWLAKQKGEEIVLTSTPVKSRKSKKAPYGYKKDGTPKKQPGRKTA